VYVHVQERRIYIYIERERESERARFIEGCLFRNNCAGLDATWIAREVGERCNQGK